MTDKQFNELVEKLSKVIIRELRHQRRTSAKPDGLMTEAQAADFLGVSPKTIGRLRSEGRIKAAIVGKRWRYRKADLEKAVTVPGWAC